MTERGADGAIANACSGSACQPVGDIATMGQTAKFGMPFAEGVHALAPSPSATAVTVIGLSGTMEVLRTAGVELTCLVPWSGGTFSVTRAPPAR